MMNRTPDERLKTGIRRLFWLYRASRDPRHAVFATEHYSGTAAVTNPPAATDDGGETGILIPRFLERA